VVVGERAKIEAGVRELALGPVRLLDPDGKPLVCPLRRGSYTAPLIRVPRGTSRRSRRARQAP